MDSGAIGERRRCPAADTALLWYPRQWSRSWAVAGLRGSLPRGRSPETELGGGHRWLLPEGSLRTSSCLFALGAFCTRCVQWFRPVWQPKLARGWGSAVPVAALGWTLSVPLSHPSAGRPHLLLSCVGWSRGAAVLSRGSPRSPTPRQPGQTQSHTTRLLWPWEHWSSCWHSVWGKRRPHFRR